MSSDNQGDSDEFDDHGDSEEHDDHGESDDEYDHGDMGDDCVEYDDNAHGDRMMNVKTM